MNRPQALIEASQRILTLMGLIFATAAIGWGQLVTTGTIGGSVSDATGALIPDAKVTLQNQQSKSSILTQTNPDGTFTAPGLVVGNYTVTIEKEGFETYSVSGIEVHPAIVTSVTAVLKVGAVATRVEVTATPHRAPLVSAASRVLDGELQSRDREALSRSHIASADLPG
jgi:hypothetical protein